MLLAAGVAFEIAAPAVDEGEHKTKLSGADLATELASAKALSVSRARTHDWVIGSDSVVRVDGRMFDKPSSRDDASEHLRFFSGRRMLLTSAVALARSGSIDWRHYETATLNVRELSEAFIEAYLDIEWPEVGYTVGVFRLEASGVQLFSSIDGDYFTVLGMPLLPLLDALRERGQLLS
jgi:septum formation protein